jgi:hypothetical protein
VYNVSEGVVLTTQNKLKNEDANDIDGVLFY